VGRYVLTINLLIVFVLFKKLDYFIIVIFWLPNFLSNLTNQKDHFMINKKTTMISCGVRTQMLMVVCW
jgi:hypothetical protein